MEDDPITAVQMWHIFCMTRGHLTLPALTGNALDFIDSHHWSGMVLIIHFCSVVYILMHCTLTLQTPQAGHICIRA